MEESFNNKLKEFDFCYGIEEYKYIYSTDVRNINEICYYKNSLKGVFAFYWFNTIRTYFKKKTKYLKTKYINIW